MGFAIAGLAAAPAWAEVEAQDRLREQFGSEFAVSLDLSGFELRGITREFAGGRGTLTIDRLYIRPGDAGLVVEIEGLEGHVTREPRTRRPQSPRVEPPSSGEPATAAAKAPADPVGERVEQLVARLQGVPVEIRTRGSIDVELPGGLSLVAHDPGLAIDGRGRLSARGRFVAGTHERDWVGGELDLTSEAGDPLALALAGSIVLDPGGVARELALAGTADPSHVHVDVDEPSGGHATFEARRGNADEADRLELLADDLPLALLDPIVELLERRDPTSSRGPAIGEARLSGRVEVERDRAGHEQRIRARFEGVELEQLVVERDWLAARPVHFGPLEIDGDLTHERSKFGQRSGGQLLLGHAGVQVQVGGQFDADGLDLGIELPQTDCQALLGAMPEGSAPVLAGSELSGSLTARFDLDLDFAALAEARAIYLGDENDEYEFDRAVERGSFDPPGALAFEFPFLDQCKVERLGPAVDVAGLAGPYHHEFVNRDGSTRSRRVLAPGDPGYVAITDIPQLELAFVILEDWRFWDHDGFDREQITKAFWYDLMAGRTRRGASTISQQTARSLWLRVDHGPARPAGFDRSVARKLVEALLTAELERQVDKRRILEVYLNIIELGPGVHGVTEAARYHFDKRPQDLDLLEALHLASLAPAPVGYTRRFASGRIDSQWREHLRLQIRRLRVRGMISEQVAERYLHPRLELVPHPELIPG